MNLDRCFEMTQTTTDYRDQLTAAVAGLRPEKGMDIIAEVMEATGVTLEHITGHQRDRRLLIARHCAMHRIREETKLSFSEIGRLFGNRHHTTVMDGIKTWRDKWSKL
jgi:chromosomal replication initiation ATPase DnaA